MDFKQLQSFVMVARCGSFTQAAQNLFISQPTVSAHVRSLEEELGRALICRTTKSIEITPKGREICEYAEQILDMRDRIVQTCSDVQPQIIRLGASTIPSAYILPQILSGFGKLYPNVYFTLHQGSSSDIEEGIQNGLFELGIVTGSRESLNCTPICRDRMVIITPVSQRYLDMKKNKEIPVAALLQEPMILRETDGADKRANRYLKRSGFSIAQLRVVARINDQEAVKNLVAGGMGISFISEIAARNYIEEKRVIAFELPNDDGRMLYLAHQKGIELSEYVKKFMNYTRSAVHQ